MAGPELQKPSAESLEAGYETSGVNIKGLVWFVVVLIVTAAVLHVGMWFLMWRYWDYDRFTDRPTSALTDAQFVNAYSKTHGQKIEVTVLPPPPAPRIQPSPPETDRIPSKDLKEMYEKEDALFRRMGWRIDEQSHAQSIPPQVISAVIQQERERQKPAQAAVTQGR